MPQKEVSVATATHELPTSGGHKFLEVLVRVAQIIGVIVTILLYGATTITTWDVLEVRDVSGAVGAMILLITLLLWMLLSTELRPGAPNYRSLRWLCPILSVGSVVAIIACSRFTADEWTAWVDVSGHDVRVVTRPEDRIWTFPGWENQRVFAVPNKESLVIETQGMVLDHRTVTLGLRGRLRFQPSIADLSPLRELLQVEHGPTEYQREVPALLARTLLQEATEHVLATRTSAEVLDPSLDTALDAAVQHLIQNSLLHRAGFVIDEVRIETVTFSHPQPTEAPR